MIRKLAWLIMTLLAIGVAGYAFVSLVIPSFRTQFVQNIFQVTPIALVLHLAGGVVAMISGAFQVNARLRNRYLVAHRWLGRFYVLAVFVSGGAGFVLALHAYGGLTTQFGFGMMAICWVITTAVALSSVRVGNTAAHREWMYRSYALTLAGVTLRVYLGLGTAYGIGFSELYPVLSWICWVPNLLMVEWVILRRRISPSKPQAISR